MDNPTTVVHCKKHPYDVLIDRSTPYGNPFTHLDTPNKAKFKVATRRESVQAYESWVMESDDPEAIWIRGNVSELQGKTLGCWCKPNKACHGDILAAMADGYVKPRQQVLVL